MRLRPKAERVFSKSRQGLHFLFSSNRMHRSLPRWSTFSLVGTSLFLTLVGYEVGRIFSPDVKPQSSMEERVQGVTAAPTVSAVKVSSPPLREGTDWKAHWQNLSRQRSTPARNRALGEMVEELARTDPNGALELAKAQNNWELRAALRNAALRGWGSVAPDAAATWAMDQRLEDRMPSVDAVLAGAAAHPEEALRIATKLCVADPVPAGDYGHAVISALSDQGNFEAAARFAAGATMVDRQSFLLESSFRQWAEHQPDQALAGLASLDDPKIRSAAYQGLVSGWADANAHQLADYAQTLPPGEARSEALSAALPRWVEKDPAAAMDWIGRFDSSADLDQGAAAVAKLPSLAQHPETAMEWADTISDRSKRLMTKYEVFNTWTRNDPAEARKFAENAKDTDERQMMMETLNREKTRG